VRGSTLLIWFALTLVASLASADPKERAARVQDLVEDAKRRLEFGDFDQRRLAIQDIEQAAVLAPHDPVVLDALGRTYLECGFIHLAQAAFTRELRDASDRASALLGLGRVAARDWLETGDPRSLDRGLRRLNEATRAGPDRYEAWIELAALTLESGDAERARQDAMHALAAAPDRPEARLAAAYLSYRRGQVALADSLFAVTLRRLSPEVAAHFDDLTPLLPRDDAERFAVMNAEQRAAFARRFWIANNPDPTSPYNLARLEFWSRLAHAMMLFGKPWSPRWVGRTELYARYGRKVQVADSKASRHYEMPWLELGEVATPPTPEALASLGQLTTGGGQAVFAPLPPGSHELPLAWKLARFEGDDRGRLIVALGTRGPPDDSIGAECAVLDRDERVMARASGVLHASACDPGNRRATEFSFDVPAGVYRIAIAVRDRHGGCGLRNTFEEVGAIAPALSMSDVVVTCGLPGPLTGATGVRLDPNLGSSVAGSAPVLAYFEVYRLRTDPRGGNHFEYQYEIQALDRDFQGDRSLLSFHTEQEGAGSMRRQFISVPAGTLKPGRYRLVVAIRDRISGAETGRVTEFLKLGETEAATGMGKP
jgi:GWxTD domain-containing protein